jgi:hypothetical protein
MDKKVFWILGALLVFIIAVNLFTRQYVVELKEAKLLLTGQLKDVPKVEQVAEEPVVRVENKVHEGIMVVSKFNKPVTQGEWDKFMKELVNNSGMLDTDEGRQALKKKSINPVQYQDTMRRLAEETQKVEEAYNKNPSDPMLQRRMEDLRKMKALTGVLVEKGVVDPNAPDLPGMNSPKEAKFSER